MKNLWLFVLLFSALVLPVFGQDHESPSASGNAFVHMCSAIDKRNPTTNESLDVMVCLGYMDGLLDGIGFEISYAKLKSNQKPLLPFCISGVESAHLIQLVLKHIREYPEDADLQTSFIVMDALGDA